MTSNFLESLFREHQRPDNLPSPHLVGDWLDGLLKLLFPEYSDQHYPSLRYFEQAFRTNHLQLFSIFDSMQSRLTAPADQLQRDFELALPQVYTSLKEDAEAILTGDPAAKELTEVIRTYPGFYALAVYRIAHCICQLGVPLIPRVLTEIAHNRTGIDIHPGATIGRRFCIDHGTGIVIGETVEIGNDIKIYQGVTLGALSVTKELARTKRHPTIQDRVIIYAGATILGGETTIGHDSIIGGNTWIIKSVAPHSRVYYREDVGVED
ncbi:MAG: serine O-acetyltransferase EpsC [Bacteroidota bacterium]